MSLEDTKTTVELDSNRELNQYLQNGWVLILTYAFHNHDAQEPRFVVAWQNESEPVFPELLDEMERKEMDRDML